MKKFAWMFFLFLNIGVLFAENPGKIIGCVMDESGGNLPGVKIEVSGETLQKKIILYAEQSGCYSVSLPPGKYQLHFELAGFTPETKNEVVVFPDREAIVDRSLRISVR